MGCLSEHEFSIREQSQVAEIASEDDESHVLRSGEQEIADAVLIPLANPSPDRDYVIHFSYPEFTCKCPMTGYPDFATLDIWLLPEHSIIELKSLKLWLNRFRDTYAFHEDVTNRILDAVVEAAGPKWVRILARWNPRGNLSTVILAEHEPKARPDLLLDAMRPSRD